MRLTAASCSAAQFLRARDDSWKLLFAEGGSRDIIRMGFPDISTLRVATSVSKTLLNGRFVISKSMYHVSLHALIRPYAVCLSFFDKAVRFVSMHAFPRLYAACPVCFLAYVQVLTKIDGYFVQCPGRRAGRLVVFHLAACCSPPCPCSPLGQTRVNLLQGPRAAP